MRIFALVFVVGVTSLLPHPSSAQSMAEAAAREKERRKGKVAKVYTEDDLKRAGGGRGGATSPDAATDAAATAKPDGAAANKDGAAPAKTDDELRAERQKDWRDRLTKANAEAARLSTEIQTLESAAGDVRQNMYGAARTAQLSRLETDRQQLATVQQTITSLEDEGRRSGFRP